MTGEELVKLLIKLDLKLDIKIHEKGSVYDFYARGVHLYKPTDGTAEEIIITGSGTSK